MATFTGSPKTISQRRILAAACGAALVVATGTGFAVWQLGGHSGRTAAARHTQPVTQQVSARSAVAPTSNRVQGPTVYLVSSDEDEQFIRQAAGSFNAPLGPDDSFVVTASDEVATALKQQVASENAILAFNSLPQVTVSDLRQALSTTPDVRISQQTASENAILAANGLPPIGSAPAGLVATTAAPKLFLVPSGADAQALQQMLAAASAGIGQAGLASGASVAQMDAAISADNVVQLLGGESRSRTAQGLQPVQVVDLR